MHTEQLSRDAIALAQERDYRYQRLTASENRDARVKFDGGLDFHQGRELAILRLVELAEASSDLDLLMAATTVRDLTQPHDLKQWELIDRIDKRGTDGNV